MTNIRFEIIDHANQKTEEWRGGVMTRMLVSAVSGAFQLCQFEQWCEPGKGAPTHLHAVEEVLERFPPDVNLFVHRGIP
jgi:hypothetical protein